MKIFLKTIGPVLIFFLVITLGFALWLVPGLSTELSQWNDDAERNNATLLAEALSADMQAQRYAAVTATLSRVWANRPDWALVEAFDAQGKRVFPASTTAAHSGLQKVSVRITGARERLGSLIVHFDGSLRNRTVRHAIREFELAVLAIGLGLLGLSLLLHWQYVTRPIRTLRNKFTHVESSAQDAAEMTFARDEIGELSRSFEEFRLELARREQALTAARQRAEEESRTNLSLRVSAEEANQAKSNFISMVSHELRTPMNAIMGMTSVIANEPLDDAMRLRIGTIEESSEHLLAVINQILDFSSSEAGKEQLEEEAFDLPALITSTMRIIESLPATRRLGISTRMDEDLPRWLHGDSRRIKQVLLNLLGNAIKFTAQGSVRLQVSAEALDPDRVRLCLAVTDSGPGIPAAMQENIFEPFVKLSGFSGGTGLGLSICRRYAVLMGGALSLQSTEGVGSTFSFCIPLRLVTPEADTDLPQVASHATENPKHPQPDSPGVEALAEPPPSAAVRPYRVLVAEDTPPSALVIQLMLVGLGHTVRLVSDGQQAVQALSEEPFDLVLMDIQMPVMDGLAATQTIRLTRQPWNTVPIVGCSALASELDRRNAMDSGMTDYLVKPVKREDFQRLIARLTEARLAGRDIALSDRGAPPEVPIAGRF